MRTQSSARCSHSFIQDDAAKIWTAAASLSPSHSLTCSALRGAHFGLILALCQNNRRLPLPVGSRLRVSCVFLAGNFVTSLCTEPCGDYCTQRDCSAKPGLSRDEEMGKRQYDGAVATFSPSPGGSIRENLCKRRAGEREREPTRLNHVCLSNIHHGGTWGHKSRENG